MLSGHDGILIYSKHQEWLTLLATVLAKPHPQQPYICPRLVPAPCLRVVAADPVCTARGISIANIREGMGWDGGAGQEGGGGGGKGGGGVPFCELALVKCHSQVAFKRFSEAVKVLLLAST